MVDEIQQDGDVMTEADEEAFKKAIEEKETKTAAHAAEVARHDKALGDPIEIEEIEEEESPSSTVFKEFMKNISPFSRDGGSDS